MEKIEAVSEKLKLLRHKRYRRYLAYKVRRTWPFSPFVHMMEQIKLLRCKFYRRDIAYAMRQMRRDRKLLWAFLLSASSSPLPLVVELAAFGTLLRHLRSGDDRMLKLYVRRIETLFKKFQSART